jgi:hypothetical protein
MRELSFPDGGRMYAQDASYLEFIAEDLIGHSAARLAIDPRSHFYDSTDVLPKSLQARLVRVDQLGEAAEKAEAIVLPIFRGLGIDFQGWGSLSIEKASERDAVLFAHELTYNLQLFIIGLDHRVQVQLRPSRIITAAANLRGMCHASDGRASLAAIEGIFRCYSTLDVPSLAFQSNARADQVEQFARFVEDETYRAMSDEAGLLGVPAKATHALIRMKRLASDLIARPRVAATMELTTSPIQAVAGVRLPASQLASRLLSKDYYLPPLVELTAAESRAASEWRSSGSPYISPPVLRQFTKGRSPRHKRLELCRS